MTHEANRQSNFELLSSELEEQLVNGLVNVVRSQGKAEVVPLVLKKKENTAETRDRLR